MGLKPVCGLSPVLSNDAEIPRRCDSRTEIAPNTLQSLNTLVEMRAPYAHLNERPLEKQEQVPKLIGVRLVGTANQSRDFAFKSREVLFRNQPQQRRLVVGEVVCAGDH